MPSKPRKQPVRRAKQQTKAPVHLYDKPTPSEKAEAKVEAKLDPQTSLPPREEPSNVWDFYMDLIEDSITVPNVIQLMVIFFIGNMTFVYYTQLKEAAVSAGNAESNIYGPLISALIVLAIAGLEFAVVAQADYKAFKALPEAEQTAEKRPQLPDFEYIYAIFLPLAVTLLAFPEQISAVGPCVVQISYLKPVVRLAVSYVCMFQLPSKTIDTFELNSAPLLFFGAYYALETYLGDSLTITERNLWAQLVLGVVYFINPATADISLIILQKLVFAYGVGLGLSLLLAAPYKAAAPGALKYALLAGIYASFFGVGTFLAEKFLTPVLGGVAPWTWIIDYVKSDPAKVEVFKYWATLFGALVPVVLLVANRLPKQLRRKVWHFAIFGALYKTIYTQPQLTAIALVGLFGVFAITELARANEIPPFGKYIKAALAPFEDEKDTRGPFVLSYIYLVLGVGITLALDNVSGTGSSVIGLVVLGLGDALASLVGQVIGKLYWPETNKTIEGSFAFFVSTALALYQYQGCGENSYDNYAILITSMLTALVEGNISINDNIVVPLLGYLSLEVIGRVDY